MRRLASVQASLPRLRNHLGQCDGGCCRDQHVPLGSHAPCVVHVEDLLRTRGLPPCRPIPPPTNPTPTTIRTTPYALSKSVSPPSPHPSITPSPLTSIHNPCILPPSSPTRPPQLQHTSHAMAAFPRCQFSQYRSSSSHETAPPPRSPLPAPVQTPRPSLRHGARAPAATSSPSMRSRSLRDRSAVCPPARAPPSAGPCGSRSSASTCSPGAVATR